MSTTSNREEFIIEWQAPRNTVADVDRDDLLDSVIREVEGDVERGNEIIRQHGGEVPWVSVGTFVVASAQLLATIIQVLQNRDDGSKEGMLAVSPSGRRTSKQLFAEDYRPGDIEAAGGTVYGRTDDGRTIFFISGTDVPELRKRVEEREAEGDSDDGETETETADGE